MKLSFSAAIFEEIADLFFTIFQRKTSFVDHELVDGLVNSQRKIIYLIESSPKISIEEMKRKNVISKTAIDKHIKK